MEIPAKYKGVRGWLLLLVLIFTFVNPAITFIILANTYGGGGPAELSGPLLVDFLFRIGLACLGVYAGISLWMIRTNAVRMARIFLVATLAYSVVVSGVVLIVHVLAELQSGPQSATDADFVQPLFASLVFVGVWYSYLKKSKRVAATYPTASTPGRGTTSATLDRQSVTEGKPEASPAGKPLNAPSGRQSLPDILRSLFFASKSIGSRNSQPLHEKSRMIWYSALWFFTVAGVFAFSWYVWPTAYRYDRINTGDSSYPVRIHRLTGKTEMLVANFGWFTLRGEEPGSKLPKEQLSKLQGEAEWDYLGKFKVSLYNGSRFDLTEITVTVRTHPSASQPVLSEEKSKTSPRETPDQFIKRRRAEEEAMRPWRNCKPQPVSRLYRLKGRAQPYTASNSFSADSGLAPCPGQTWEWSIVEASGTAR